MPPDSRSICSHARWRFAREGRKGEVGVRVSYPVAGTERTEVRSTEFLLLANGCMPSAPNATLWGVCITFACIFVVKLSFTKLQLMKVKCILYRYSIFNKLFTACGRADSL